MLSESEFDRDEDADGEQMIAVYQKNMIGNTVLVLKDGKEIFISGMAILMRR